MVDDQNTTGNGDEFEEAFDEFTAEEQEQGQNPQEEAATQEPEPEQQEEPQEQEEDWQHKYDSMMGRLKASQKEVGDLQARIRELEAAQMQQPEQQEDLPGMDDIDLDGIDEKSRALFREKSPEGERARKLLDEFGSDFAQNYADQVADRRAFEEFSSQQRRAAEEEQVARHKRALAEAVPEFADAVMGRNQAQWTDLCQGVKAWIDTLPYSEGVRMNEIADHGSTEDVVTLLRRYSDFRSGGTARNVRSLAQQNIAVPRRGTPMPQPQAAKDDFDAAWEEATHAR